MTDFLATCWMICSLLLVFWASQASVKIYFISEHVLARHAVPGGVTCCVMCSHTHENTRQIFSLGSLSAKDPYPKVEIKSDKYANREKNLKMQIYDCHKKFYNFKKTLIRSAKVFKTIKKPSWETTFLMTFLIVRTIQSWKWLHQIKSSQVIDQFKFDGSFDANKILLLIRITENLF